MIEGNLLIRASAGTGKTFALATRYIRLMLFDGVAPERIVALTFSRAAAQEIYTKILERLWKAASGDAQAQAERRNLEEGLSDAQRGEIARRKAPAWGRGLFAGLLRKVVDAQHSGAIATLDSFILRIVRNFPLELGFQNAVEVLDGAGEREAVERAMRDVLARTEQAEGFMAAFRAARGGKMPRVLAHALDYMMDFEGWRAFILAHPESRAWTADSMADELGVRQAGPCPDVSAVAAEGAFNPAAGFLKHLRAYDGTKPVFPATKAGELMRHLARNPTATDFGWTTDGGGVRHFEYGAAGAEAIREGVRHMVRLFLRRQLEVVEAKLRLFSEIDRVYNEKMRRAGKLTFGDFTKFSAAKEGTERGLALENLEFRFDAQFDHWALDEFQDTSEVQWKCLERLVSAAAHQGGGRTVIAVGDLKQAIYAWRGGDEAPFKAMMGWPAFTCAPYGRIADAKVSHRYQKNICDFVNAVFGPDNLLRGGVLPAARRSALARWLAEDCWKRHEPERDADGAFKAHDHVKVVGVPRASTPDRKGVEALLPALAEQVEAVWRAHARACSTEEIGVLVRKNDEGTAVAECLRARGLPVVWEGLNAVSDVPAVQAVLCLLKLADHPEDTFAWETVSRLLPVREILFPDAAAAGPVSRRVAADLSRSGLARTLKDYCGRLGSPAEGLDALSRERLQALVRAGVAYERRCPKDFGVDGFARFLAATGRRARAASSKVIRVLTIHRSKGLTLDRVFVPICESPRSSIVRPKDKGVVYGKNRAWVLPHVPDDVAAMNDAVAAVVAEQGDERLLEALRTYYVALTRARKALYVVQPVDPDGQVHFRTLVEQAVCGGPPRDEGAARVLFEAGAAPPFSAKAGGPRPPAAWRPEGARVCVARVSPSQMHAGSEGRGRAAALFDTACGAAAQRGVEAHAAYEGIEWADAEEAARLPEAFRAAFVKPSADAAVWRERSYEIFDGARWETGRFDRVVFTGTGASRTATLYDFKTNAKLPQETPEAFARRMGEAYAPQMAAYRRALARLTGIPAARIAATLLLEATGEAVGVRVPASRSGASRGKEGR